MGEMGSKEAPPTRPPAHASRGGRPQVSSGVGQLQATGTRIDHQIKSLERRILKSEEDARLWVARSGTEPAAKVRAMQCLKQKKMYEQHRDQLLGTQFNVETLQFQAEQAEVTALAVQAMQAGHNQMKHQQARISVDEIERLQEDMTELNGEFADIQEALARAPPDAASVEEDFESEWERLREEAAAETLAQGIPPPPLAAPASSVGASRVPPAPTPSRFREASVPVGRSVPKVAAPAQASGGGAACPQS